MPFVQDTQTEGRDTDPHHPHPHQQPKPQSISQLIQDLTKELRVTQGILGSLCRWVGQEFSVQGHLAKGPSGSKSKCQVPVPQNVVNYGYSDWRSISHHSDAEVVAQDLVSNTNNPPASLAPAIDWNNDGAEDILRVLLGFDKVPPRPSTKCSLLTPSLESGSVTGTTACPEKFPCQFCPLTFQSAQHLQVHGMSHCFVPIERMDTVVVGPDTNVHLASSTGHGHGHVPDLDIEHELKLESDAEDSNSVDLDLDALASSNLNSPGHGHLDLDQPPVTLNVPKNVGQTIHPISTRTRTFLILAPDPAPVNLNGNVNQELLLQLQQNELATTTTTTLLPPKILRTYGYGSKKIIPNSQNSPAISGTIPVPLSKSHTETQSQTQHQAKRIRKQNFKGQGYRRDLYGDGQEAFVSKKSTTPQQQQQQQQQICQTCGKLLASIDSLRRHELIHRGLRPFACSNCERSFNQISSLRRHRLTHVAPDQRPTFHCPIENCDRKYVRKEFLKLHVRENHRFTNNNNNNNNSDNAHGHDQEFDDDQILSDPLA